MRLQRLWAGSSTTPQHITCRPMGCVSALWASLKSSSWLYRFPWVLIGLRTAPQEDLQSSSAELVYGQPLRVPGDFILSTTALWSATRQRSMLLDDAKAFLQVTTSQYSLPQSHVPTELQSVEYVFIRHDAHCGPLQAPHDGPFRVQEDGVKYFVVELGDRLSRVSVDRLKPAHLNLDCPVGLTRPPCLNPTWPRGP